MNDPYWKAAAKLGEQDAAKLRKKQAMDRPKTTTPELKRKPRPELARASKGELCDGLRITWRVLTDYENACAGISGCESKLELLTTAIATVEECGKRFRDELRSAHVQHAQENRNDLAHDAGRPDGGVQPG